jgi:hypothetical protein
MSVEQTDWQKLIEEKIKITLVAHVTLAGRSLGQISIDQKQPKNFCGDNLKLELFAGEVSDDELCVLRQLLEVARIGRSGIPYHSRLRQMELELAKIKSYKWCLRNL